MAKRRRRRQHGLERDDRGRFLRRVKRRASKKRRRTKKAARKRGKKRSGRKGVRSTIMEFIKCGKKK